MSEQTRKLALLHAVSRNCRDPMIDGESTRWAIQVVEHQTRRMLFMAGDHVARNDFDAMAKEVVRSANPVMQSYIYHFIGKSKPYMKACRWRRFDPPELPFPGDAKAKALIRDWGKQPPTQHDIGPIFIPRHAANLLAVNQT